MNSQDNRANALPSDLDAELLAFIRTRANTFIKWDLIRFFYDNPHIVEPVERIAAFVGKDAAAIQVDLTVLAEAGVLAVSGSEDAPVYGLVADEHMQALIARFYHACTDRTFRVKAMYHVIRAGGKQAD